jgi:hypothetical protein
VPTVPPPSDEGDELLIPVTGLKVPFSWADMATKQAFLSRISAQSGLVVLGLGLVFRGAALWQKKQEDRDTSYLDR